MTTSTVQNRKTCMKNDIDGLPLRCQITKVHAAQQPKRTRRTADGERRERTDGRSAAVKYQWKSGEQKI